MANTTNFGWETPDDTDLVKDGALAMRTLGNAIDTSLVDLKGGTTGQILAKNTNTDMDFVWITNDQGDITEVVAGTGLSGGGTSGSVTLTNTVATAYDAKGDLIVGTGADTFAKRTVGTNEHRLVADSAETTGLKYVADTTNYAIAAKGDLLAGTAADTVAALTLGTNNQVLTVDTSTATGLKWASPSTGGWTLIASGSLGSSGTNLTSIAGTYRDLRLIVRDYRPSADGGFLGLRFNNDSGANRYHEKTSDTDGLNTGTSFDGTGWRASSNTDDTAADGLIIITIPDYANSTTWKFMLSDSVGVFATNTAQFTYTRLQGFYNQTAAITQVNMYPSSGSITSGTYELYGVA